MRKEEQEKELEKMGVRKPQSEVPVFALSSSSEAMLKKYVNDSLALDIRSRNLVQGLLKTDKTMENSLGDLKEYLDSLSFCLACPGTLLACPKREKGYTKSLVYDESGDRIRCVTSFCPWKKETEKNLDLIHPKDVDGMALYSAYASLFALLHSEKDLKVYKKTGDIFKSLLKTALLMKKGKKPKGFSLYSINSYALTEKILMASSYLFAKLGYRTCYIHLEDLATSLASRDYSLKALAKEETERTLPGLSVWVLDGIDNLPFERSGFYASFLPGLLSLARKKGILVLLGRAKEAKTENALRMVLKGSALLPEALENLKSLAPDIVDRDLPV